MSYLLNHTSVDELDSSIRCAISNGHPFEIDRLKASLDNERRSTVPRKTIINLLEREIRRQGKGSAA